MEEAEAEESLVFTTETPSLPIPIPLPIVLCLPRRLQRLCKSGGYLSFHKIQLQWLGEYAAVIIVHSCFVSHSVGQS